MHTPSTHTPEIRTVELSPEDYGADFYSRDAYLLRAEEDIPPECNIATFHFVTRPGIPGPRKTSSMTRVSTGTGAYILAKPDKAESAVRINTSHSERLIIEPLVQQYHVADAWWKAKAPDEAAPGLQEPIPLQFPRYWVIDWVYTERPACRDAYWFNERQHAGCRSEIGKMQSIQREGRWDLRPPQRQPYSECDDLGITVYSTFPTTEAQPVPDQIRRSLAFRQLWAGAVTFLAEHYARELEPQYEGKHGKEEFDLAEFDSLQAMARQAAINGLGSWNDNLYRDEDGQPPPPTQAGIAMYEHALRRRLAELTGSSTLAGYRQVLA